jgi:hypothetical protein
VTLYHPLLYGWRAAPSKEDGGTLERGTNVYPAPTRDDTVTSDQWSASPSSPSALCSHPCYCATIPGAAVPSLTLLEHGTTRQRHACCCASYGLPSAEPSRQHTDGDRTGSSHTATLEAAPRREQESPRRQTGARFAKTAIHSVALYIIPPHVVRTVRHDCKPPLFGL